MKPSPLPQELEMGGFWEAKNPNEFGKGSSLVLNELHHDNMP